jgi:site-specific DNA recombinase
MEERGLTSRFGRPLSRTHIRKLLTNRFYIGELWWDAKAYGKGNHVAIIKKTVFDMVKNKLESKNIPKRRKHNTLFKGLITCEECSSIITWELHKGTYYGRCKGYRNCSRKTYAKQHEIEQELLNRFETLLAPSPDIAEWTKEAIKLRHENDMAAYYATMNRMKERHTDLARRIDVAYDDRADGRITVEKYDSKVELWETEQEAILEQLSSFDDTYHARLAHNLNVLELSQRANEIYQSKTSVEDRRALLGELFSNLTLNGPSLSVEYHETVKFIAQKAEKSRALKKSFELDNNGSTKQNILRENAQKDIWLRR